MLVMASAEINKQMFDRANFQFYIIFPMEWIVYVLYKNAYFKA